MIDGRVIRGIDLTSESFKKSFKRLKDVRIQTQVKETLRTLLLLDLDQTPAKLHLHPLTNKLVISRLDSSKKVNAWSLHVTPNDDYKASFTYENGVCYFRLVDEHDIIDKNP